jgi:hypothetical protein
MSCAEYSQQARKARRQFRTGPAQFLGRWLLAAAKADQTLQKRFNQNPSLKQKVDRLEVVHCIHFSSASTRFVELLMKNLICFTLPLDEQWGEMFVVMVEVGFFRLTGNRYQMTYASAISGAKIEAALLRLAVTEDDEHFLHPEYLVICLSRGEAERWKTRLERLPCMQREADRAFLLGEL